MLNKNQFLSEEERLDKFAAFLEENVLPTLKKNEEILDDLYESALEINQKADICTLKKLSDSILFNTQISTAAPKIQPNIGTTKAYSVPVTKMAFGNQFVEIKTPKMSDKTKIDLPLGA